MIRLLAALAAGGLLPLSLAPFNYWPLAFVSLGLWFYVLQRTRGRGLLAGWLFGVGKYAVGASWVYVSIHVHGNAPPLVAGLLVTLFVAGLALFSMANGWLFVRLRPQSWQLGAGWFAVCFSGFEWLLTWVFTGFPWLYPGYGFLDTPLAGFAPLGGVQLVSFVVAGIAGAAVILVRWIALFRRRLATAEATADVTGDVPARIALGAALVCVAPWVVGGLLRTVTWTQPTARHEAALVQGNIEQQSKWRPESRQPIIDTYLRLSDAHWGVDLLLWPEAAITLLEHQAGELLEALDARGKLENTGLILGIPSLEPLPGGGVVFRNTAIGLGSASGRYSKRRLVPFGEYVPLENVLRGLIEFFDLPMSSTQSGDWQQPLLDVAGAKAQMAICYEIVYPALVRSDADVLLTVSNDTWFGESIGPHQHLEMARMRAVENGRWLLRATNNGLTAIVDPKGVLRARLPQFEEGVLRGSYETMAGRTPYNRFGDWPLEILLVTLAAVLLGLRLREE